MPEPHMEVLHHDECRKLLAERHLGRLAIPDFGGPVIFPVNYVFDQDLVIFRTALGVLVALTVAELRRLLARLVWPPPVDPAFTLAWSLWRRRHQATARRAHYQQQRGKLRL